MTIRTGPISWFRTGILSLGILTWLALPAAVPAQNSEVEELRKQLRELQLKFEQAQKEQQHQLEVLSKKIEDMTREQSAAAEKKKLEEELAAELAKGATAETNAPAAPAPAPIEISPSSLRIGNGKAYMDLGLVGTFAVGGSTASDIAGGTELGGHDPNQRGFTVQGVELNLAGAVDPYFRGNVNLLFGLDENSESFFELEEAWLETLSMPANLQVRAGQILTDFGRQNPTHPHSWAFVDTPLVLGRFFGPDGLRNPGARLSWLAPTPFYSELFLTVQNSQGDTAYSFRSDLPANGTPNDLPFAYRHAENDRGVAHMQDLLFTPRYAASFDLTDTQVLLLGASAAFGPNSSGDSGGGDTTTQIYGLDFTWKWKSPHQHAGFPFVSFQTEALLRRYDAGAFNWDENHNGLVDEGEILDQITGAPAILRRETLVDYGFYSQVLYGFRRNWVAGLRFDYVTGDKANYESRPLFLDGEPLGRDPQRAERWRISPDLTWYPSEFSKIRLQYNLDRRSDIGTDHSVWLQFELILGAHAAHKF